MLELVVWHLSLFAGFVLGQLHFCRPITILRSTNGDFPVQALSHLEPALLHEALL